MAVSQDFLPRDQGYFLGRLSLEGVWAKGRSYKPLQSTLSSSPRGRRCNWRLRCFQTCAASRGRGVCGCHMSSLPLTTPPESPLLLPPPRLSVSRGEGYYGPSLTGLVAKGRLEPTPLQDHRRWRRHPPRGNTRRDRWQQTGQVRRVRCLVVIYE